MRIIYEGITHGAIDRMWLLPKKIHTTIQEKSAFKTNIYGRCCINTGGIYSFKK